MEGRDHQRRIETKELLSKSLVDPSGYCEYCFTKLQEGVQRNAHLRSNSHQLQIKRRIEYLKYIKSQALNMENPVEADPKKTLKSCKTYTNMFSICESESFETFNEIQPASHIFKKAGLQVYKYFNKDLSFRSDDENKDYKDAKTFNYIEDELISLNESSSIDNRSSSFGEKQADDESSGAFSSMSLDETNEACKIDGNVDEFIQENFSQYKSYLEIAFESIIKASTIGNN